MNGHFMKRGRNQRRRQGVNPNRALDSNGPDVRIRGTAQQIYDKYLALARDATSSGDRVKAENYLQHAEHYFRVLRSVQGAPQQSNFDQNVDGDIDGDQPNIGEAREHRPHQPDSEIGDEADADTDDSVAMEPAPANEAEGRADNRRPNGGDHEGRRRRRRPRRDRHDEQQSKDEQPEPVTA